MGQTSEKTKSHGKREPVYRDPEKRRQQNIKAQRKYRENVRARLQILNRISHDPSINWTPVNATVREAASRDLSTISSGWQPVQAITCSSAENMSTLSSDGEPLSWAVQSSDTWQTDTMEYATGPTGSNSLTFSTPTASRFPAFTLPFNDHSSISHYWGKTDHRDFPSVPVSEDTSGYRMTDAFECCCANLHLTIQRLVHDHSGSAEIRTLRRKPTAQISDPYLNHIRLNSLCTLAAMDNLRAHLGITEEMVCIAKFGSPFFRPIKLSADKAARSQIVSAVQNIFKTLKPELQPVVEQILVDHPPYIDILPFRTLRKNLILQQELVNEREFLQDVAAGLLCWGGAGRGTRNQSCLDGFESAETPWEARSWEAKTWFLQKYWRLLGGKDGELVRQSAWWCSMRGENVFNTEVLTT